MSEIKVERRVAQVHVRFSAMDGEVRGYAYATGEGHIIADYKFVESPTEARAFAAAIIAVADAVEREGKG